MNFNYSKLNRLSFYSFFLYRLIYNICRCVVQFVMPMLVVLGVYISIFWRLKNRPISKNSTNFKRRRRTNIMVISVSITFFLSWLPLNTLNFLLDVESLNKHSKEVRIKTNFQAARQLRSLICPCFSAANCHLVVLLSCLGFRAKEAIEAIKAIEAMVIYCAAYGIERLFCLVIFQIRNKFTPGP